MAELLVSLDQTDNESTGSMVWYGQELQDLLEKRITTKEYKDPDEKDLADSAQMSPIGQVITTDTTEGE